jgi:hypothetical protein
MFEKQGKFYADWRDRKGNRKRKSFTTARAALRFEEEQKELAHPKTQARRTPLPNFSAHVSKGRTPANPTKSLSLVRSPKQPVPCLRANSAPRTSSTRSPK